MRTEACASSELGRSARALIAPTGLRFCGIADEPPAPPPSRTSRDLRLREQHDVERDLRQHPRGDRRAPRRARRSGRGSCARASSASARPSSLAYSRAISGPCSPSAASVPAAPPSCAASPSSRSSASRERASSSGHEPSRRLEPERRRHGLLQERPTGHRRRRGGRARAPRTRRRRDRARRARGRARRRATSIAAVSITSWVVAPRCTHRAASSPDAVDESAHERLGRVRRPAAPRAASAPSRSVVRTQAEAIAAAASAGTTPACAPACASARSASSIAASHARPETASRSSSGTKRGANGVTPRRMSYVPAPAGGCRSAGRRPRRPRPAWRGLPRRGARAPDRRRSPRPRRGSRSA